MGVAKTCISEICCKEHELRAFGILNGMWGLGEILIKRLSDLSYSFTDSLNDVLAV